MQYHIETERLLLKPVAPEDVSAMFIWTSDPEVNPYLSYPLHHDVSVMQKWIASLRPENLEFCRGACPRKHCFRKRHPQVRISACPLWVVQQARRQRNL